MGTDRAVEVLHDRGSAAPNDARWTSGSGYLVGGRLVLTAAHNVDYQQGLSKDEQLLIRTIAGSKFAARVVLVCDKSSQTDLALLEITGPRFDEQMPPVRFARVNQGNPAPVSGCWAVGFPRFGEAGLVLPEGSRKDTWEVFGDIMPGTKQRAEQISLQVTSGPAPVVLTGSAWEGMSGALVFATDPHYGELAVGVIALHHQTEGQSALTLVPIVALAGLPAAADWWHLLGVADSHTLPVLPRPSAADERSSRLAGQRALKEHWDPRGRGVEQAARSGWFFTGRGQALSQLVAWLTAAPRPVENLRVVTGGPGSGKSAVLARLVTMSDPQYRARMPGQIASGNPVADLPPGVINIAVHARTASADEVVTALAAVAGTPPTDLNGLIEWLLERQETFTIVVDALDEAADPPALARALRKLASQTADAGVRLLVGTRPGGPDSRLITALGLSARGDDPALIDLDDPGYLAREDLTEYVRRRLLLTDIPPSPYRDRETLAGQVAAAVARAAYPAFLICQLVSRALLLRAQPLSPDEPGWQDFPTTVAAAMDDYLAGIGDQEEQDHVEDLLRPLAYALGDGLPLDDAGLWPRLATALARPGRSYAPGDVATLLDTAADYLIEAIITGQSAYYRLYHQALSDRLRERERQHLRPVSAELTVYQCLLGTVARRPDDTCDWQAAHPYLHSQLAGHAADVGQLTSLLNDPGFLIAADPARLFAALQRPGQPLTGTAQIYRYAYPQLPHGADMAGERASYLQLAAQLHGAHLADQLDKLPLRQPWTARWVRGPRPHPHYIAGRHDGNVRVVAVGERHGRPVIISGSGGTVRVWDLESGEPALGLLAHPGVIAVAVGERHGRPVVISGGSDGTLRVWDLESGEPVLGPLTVSDRGAFAVAVGERHGRPVIVSCGQDGTLRVWDLGSGEQVLGPLTVSDRGAFAVAVGERHGRPVIISGGIGTVLVWDLESGELVLGPLTGHDGGVFAVAVGERHGRPVIISGGVGTVSVWDLESGELVLGPLTAPVMWTMAVGQRHGQPVIVSDFDGGIQVWDLESGEPVLGPLTDHDRGVNAVAVGERHGRPVIVSGGVDGTVRVWDLESGEPSLGRPGAFDDQVNAVAVGERQGRPVIISGSGSFSDGTVRVWDLESGEPVLGPLTGHDHGVNAVAVGERRGRPVIVSADGVSVYGMADGTVRVWDLESGEPVLGPLTGHKDGVEAVAIGQRQGRPVIISGGMDGTVRVWDLESGEPVLGPLADPELGVVRAVAVGERQGRPVIISGGHGGQGGIVRVWDLESGELVLGLLIGRESVMLFAVAVGQWQGRPVIISGGGNLDGGTVRVWDLESGELVLAPLTGHESEMVSTVALGQWQGRPVIISGGDSGHGGTVQVWDLEAARHATLRIDLQHRVLSVASAADRLVIGSTVELLRIDLL